MGARMTKQFVLAFVAAAISLQAQTARHPGGTLTGPPIVASYATLEGHAEVTPIVPPPSALGLSPFYKKYVDAGGIPVAASARVRDDALLLARDIVNFMLSKRPDVRAVMVQRKSRLLVMSIDEGVTRRTCVLPNGNHNIVQLE
jgi:hypothetical protein